MPEANVWGWGFRSEGSRDGDWVTTCAEHTVGGAQDAPHTSGSTGPLLATLAEGCL